jgi:hypothetical protein
MNRISAAPSISRALTPAIYRSPAAARLSLDRQPGSRAKVRRRRAGRATAVSSVSQSLHYFSFSAFQTFSVSLRSTLPAAKSLSFPAFQFSSAPCSASALRFPALPKFPLSGPQNSEENQSTCREIVSATKGGSVFRSLATPQPQGVPRLRSLSSTRVRAPSAKVGQRPSAFRVRPLGGARAVQARPRSAIRQTHLAPAQPRHKRALLCRDYPVA